MSGFEYIRRAYNVPAKKGGKVKLRTQDNVRSATIVGTRKALLKIRDDGDGTCCLVHPTNEHLSYGVE